MSRPVALVTGARRGIGLAIAVAFAEGGYDIAFTDIVDDEAVEDAELAIGEAGGAAFFVQHDVADLASHEGLIGSVLESYGKIDCFVSNAGIASPARGDLLDLDPAHFDRVMAINLRGAMFLSQAVARLMLKRPASRRSILFVTSVSAEMASPERADYCVSKAALSMWVKNLALRLAPEKIPVFELRPGVIRTDMTAAVAEKYQARIEGGLVPAGRWGEGADVARMALALAGGAFDFATGSAIACDGALSIPRL
ncbi:3-ketoacyl-ACP reductase [Labrys monachus]|uniref:NAD(P)-dependent dehydrogenase (Short-subunit alcohol dehydrogenase family) n=1 Tax=Labrys monachus TaxID=217067 RepID=A0ABU0FJN0_9HYPH|nr:3-ketoacyl-ACP reductase [Labrys monachus]MDQ0394731.1 NAD(P)-dependent dehydrogenase (short-subunit alcohol dehydrogenase family) [Labrys monachus]